MFPQVLRYVRLPLLLILIWAIGRFILGLRGVPYAPRGNAVFSIIGLTFISCFYFGAMARKVGGFGWGGTALTGAVLGLWAQILIFTATIVSIALNLNTYFIHWDALNLPPDTTATMSQALTTRAFGLVTGTIICAVLACLGRLLFGALAPTPRDREPMP